MTPKFKVNNGSANWGENEQSGRIWHPDRSREVSVGDCQSQQTVSMGITSWRPLGEIISLSTLSSGM